MEERFTGDHSTTTATTIHATDSPPLGAWQETTLPNEFRCSAYAAITAPDSQSRSRPTAAGDLPRAARLSTPQRRHDLHTWLSTATNLASQLVEACHHEDPMAKAIAGHELLIVLQELWELRDVREDEWADLLNFIQAALEKEIFEKMTLAQAQIVRQVVVEHLSTGSIELDDIKRLRKLLRSEALDPWKAISADPSE